MRWPGLGMLVRHYSFPDKDLQRRKPSSTRRNYRHSRFSQNSQANLHQRSTLKIRGGWVWWRFTGRALWEQGEALAAPELTTADTSGLQAVNGLGVVGQHNLTENKDAVSRFSDNFWNNLFLLLIRKLINMFHAHFSRTFSYYAYSGLFLVSMTFFPDSLTCQTE